jgi:hypothetical protein
MRGVVGQFELTTDSRSSERSTLMNSCGRLPRVAMMQATNKPHAGQACLHRTQLCKLTP